MNSAPREEAMTAASGSRGIDLVISDVFTPDALARKVREVIDSLPQR